MKNETNKKLYSLTKKWQAIFADSDFDIFTSICKIIEEDPKFKLPWTQAEVRFAVDSIKQAFNLND